MRSLILIMALLFTVLASPVLRSRVIQDVDTYGNRNAAQGSPVNLAGSVFGTVPNLASADLERASSTGSVGTTLDLHGYGASTDSKAASVITPTNFGDNVFVGAPGQQDDLIAAVDQIKPGWNSTPENPCPNMHTLCSKKIQYFVLAYVTNAVPCAFLLTFQVMALAEIFMLMFGVVAGDGAEDPNFQQCDRGGVYCCSHYNAKVSYP